MATKKEVWSDAEGDECSNELDALCADLWIAERASSPESESPELTADVASAIDALHEYAHRGDEAANKSETTHLPIRKGCSYRCRDGEVRLCENVDMYGLAYFGGLAAVHASNGLAFEDGSEQSKYDVLGEVTDHGTTLPEGVPPELDDWVKRWEWITARVTLEQVRELREGDEVRIGLRWFPVTKCGMHVVWIRTAYVSGDVGYAFEELTPIANEVRYNGR